MKRILALAALALAGCGGSTPAPGANTTLVCAPVTYPANQGAEAEIDGVPPVYDWQTHWQSCEVMFPSRKYGSQLYGVLFAPQDIDLQNDRLPAIVIAPGSGTGVQAQYNWSARELAGHGYIALTVDPQGVGHSELVDQPQTSDNYVDGVESALDYLVSNANPLRTNIDIQRIGAAGHSLSARAVSYVQGIDVRVKAIVAWDNLSSTLAGDAGISSGGGAGGQVIGGELPGGDPRAVTVNVPAMGQASDAPGSTTQDNDPEVKKTAYEVWRGQGISAMEVVFLGAAHIDWGQAQTASADSAGERSRQLQLFEFYTRAWFDYWLKHDDTALGRLTTRDAVGFSREQVYSVDFRSALFLPGLGIDCPDILTGNCPAFAP